MTALAFDTHRIVKRLQEAGFSETQAEVVTTVVQEAWDVKLDHLVTKGDLKVAISNLRDDLQKHIYQVVMSALAINVIAVLAAMVGFAKLLGH